MNEAAYAQVTFELTLAAMLAAVRSGAPKAVLENHELDALAGPR